MAYDIKGLPLPGKGYLQTRCDMQNIECKNIDEWFRLHIFVNVLTVVNCIQKYILFSRSTDRLIQSDTFI